MNGNTHVGLRSNTLGRVIIGRQDVHYLSTESDLTALAGDLRADSVSLLAFMANGVAIANASRTPNIVHYTTPKFGGFSAIVAYSTGPTANAAGRPNVSNVGAAAGVAATAAQQADLSSAIRKGSAFHFSPDYEATNWQAGYSYWNMKPDSGQTISAAATQLDQRSNKLYGAFRIAGFNRPVAGQVEADRQYRSDRRHRDQPAHGMVIADFVHHGQQRVPFPLHLGTR